MAVPVLMLEPEIPVEERVARLEVNVEHIRSDISEMRLDIRRLNDKVDGIKDSVNALTLNVEKSFATLNIGRVADRVWWLLMSGALLGIVARAFKWL